MADGVSVGSSLYTQTERELVASLNNPRIHYLDYFTGEYDHAAHLTNDRVVQLKALEEVDALVGRIWTAISKSPLADSTVLVMVSDHGNEHIGGSLQSGLQSGGLVQ